MGQDPASIRGWNMPSALVLSIALIGAPTFREVELV